MSPRYFPKFSSPKEKNIEVCFVYFELELVSINLNKCKFQLPASKVDNKDVEPETMLGISKPPGPSNLDTTCDIAPKTAPISDPSP